MSDYIETLEAAMTAAALHVALFEGSKAEETILNSKFFQARSALWAAKSRDLKMDLDLYKMIANHEYASLNTKEAIVALKACMHDKRVHQFIAEQAPNSIVDLIQKVVLKGKPFSIADSALPESKRVYMSRLNLR